MARIRSLKPELWLSPQVMNLSHPARLLFIGLITQADDEGRGPADIRRLKAAIFPGDDVTTAQVTEWLKELVDNLLITLYAVQQSGQLFQLPTWHLHQAINRPRPSTYPPPEGHSVKTHGGITEGSLGIDRSDRRNDRPTVNGQGMQKTPERIEQDRVLGALAERTKHLFVSGGKP